MPAKSFDIESQCFWESKAKVPTYNIHAVRALLI
jgi:hypothetical protein